MSARTIRRLGVINLSTSIRSVISRLLLLSCISPWTLEASEPSYLDRDPTREFMAEMVREYQFKPQELERWFASAEKKQSILDAISRPAERTLNWTQYRKIFLTASRIDAGVDFWRENKAVLTRAEQTFGVPTELIVAIIGVETFYGRNKGSFRVMDALSTLAFDYPPRSRFFRGELVQFLLLAREQGQDPLNLFGSYAGAMGYGQFIPSSYRAYAIDFNDDKVADIWQDPEDAIGSVANYIHRHGWQSGQPVAVRARLERDYDASLANQSLKPQNTVKQLAEAGYTAMEPVAPELQATAMRLQGQWGFEYWLGMPNFYVITRYNHSRLYAMAVWQLSEAIARAYVAR